MRTPKGFFAAMRRAVHAFFTAAPARRRVFEHAHWDQNRPRSRPDGRLRLRRDRSDGGESSSVKPE